MRNILALTGDPPRVGDYPTGTGVWDVDSIGLIEILARLNRGEDQAGSPIGQQAGFTIACALDPTAADAATEWDRLERKLAAGAHLVMTQPLYDVAQVEAMLAEARRRFGPGGFPVPVLLGVLPLVCARHAEFLHHEVPGITIPDAAARAMHAAGRRGSEAGIDMADALLAAVEGEVAGTYLMPSFGRYEQAAELVRRIRRAIRPRRRGHRVRGIWAMRFTPSRARRGFAALGLLWPSVAVAAGPPFPERRRGPGGLRQRGCPTRQRSSRSRRRSTQIERGPAPRSWSTRSSSTTAWATTRRSSTRSR